jgi:CTD kinase subunit alpha
LKRVCHREDPANVGFVYMVFEYMDHDLAGILSHPTFTFEPAHIKELLRQMFEGLHYLHHRGILHRDIKGSNILLSTNGQLKLADFGLARHYHKRRDNLDYTNRVITLWYRPPELLLGTTTYGPAVDIWSIGCIMLEMITKKAIFPGQNEIDQLTRIWNIMGTPTVETWPKVLELPWWELVKPQAVSPEVFHRDYERYVLAMKITNMQHTDV